MNSVIMYRSVGMRKGRRINRMQESRFKLIQNRIRITTVERQCNLQTYVNHVSCLYLWSIRHNCKEETVQQSKKSAKLPPPNWRFRLWSDSAGGIEKKKRKRKIIRGLNFFDTLDFVLGLGPKGIGVSSYIESSYQMFKCSVNTTNTHLRFMMGSRLRGWGYFYFFSASI